MTHPMSPEERPRVLYERLGYEVFAEEQDAFEVEDVNGTVSMYHGTFLLLRKQVLP